MPVRLALDFGLLWLCSCLLACCVCWLYYWFVALLFWVLVTCLFSRCVWFLWVLNCVWLFGLYIGLLLGLLYGVVL